MLTFAAMPPAVVEAVMSARQEARVRTTVDDRAPVAIDTETSPSGTLQLRARGARAWLTYAPRLTGRDLNLDASTLFLHTGAAGVSAIFRRVTLTLQQDASYGSQNFAGAALATSATTTLPRLDTLPAAQTIRLMSLQTSLSGAFVLAPRWRLQSLLTYGVAGGATEESLAILPRLYGPAASVDSAYALSRRAAFLGHASFARSTASTGVVSTIASVAAGFSYVLGRRTTSSLLGGLGMARSRLAGGLEASPLPVASASITHRPNASRSSGRYTATAGLTPFIDRLTGRVDLRADGSLAGSWPLAARTTFQLLGGAGRSFGALGLPPITIVLVEASVAHAPHRWLRVDGGIRGAYQAIDGSPTGAASPSQASVFAAVTVVDTVRLFP